MTDTATIDRAPWLEAHDEFEGVGAHELNPRYAHVDGGDWDAALRAELAHLAPSKMTPALFTARTLLATASTVRLDGIDISHWQYDAGPVDWGRVARIPTFWGACKATQSIRYIDPTFARARAEMAAAGLRHRGLYHWLSSTTDPEQQAAHYLDAIGALQPGEFVLLDSEEQGVTVAMALAFFEYVERRTRRPGSDYTGAFVAGGTIWQSAAVRESEYGPRPMSLAAYTTEAKARALPGVAAHPWHAWQFSSNGPVAGITGRCDMNRVDDIAVYDLAAGLTAATAPPPVIPTESPTVQEDPDMEKPFIVTNSEPFAEHGPGVVKFRVVPVLIDGNPAFKVQHLNIAQWKALGADPGVPLTNAEINTLTAV